MQINNGLGINAKMQMPLRRVAHQFFISPQAINVAFLAHVQYINVSRNQFQSNATAV